MEYIPIERPSDAFQQPIPLDSIVAMCKGPFGSRTPIESVYELSGGGFNNVYLVVFGRGKRAVLRVAPKQDVSVNSSEQIPMYNGYIMHPYFAPVAHLMPKTLMIDFTHQIIDRDYLFQTFMEGEQWASIQDQLTEDDKRILLGQLGAITKQIHSVKGGIFSSSSSQFQSSLWSDVVLERLQQCVQGVESYKLDATIIKDIIEVAQVHREFLDEIAQPHLLHGDLWIVNILLKRMKSGPRITAILDADGASWGDPMADWTMFMLNWHKPKGAEAFWKHYGEVETGLGADVRQLIYQGMHIAGALVEGQRLGREDILERGNRDIKNTIAQLQVLTT